MSPTAMDIATGTTGGAVLASRYVALGHDFAFEVDDPVFASVLGRVLSPLAATGTPETRYVVTRDDSGERPAYVLHVDETELGRHTLPHLALGRVLWHINRQVVERSPHLVLVHAAGVERDDVGLMLAAPMESGKTTLAAGLVRSGFRYLTDESVAIDPGTLLVQPYPKALSLDRGSWPVLGDLRPEAPSEEAPFYALQWHVPATMIREDALAPATRIGVVVTPRYDRGAATAVKPISRAAMLVELARNTFHFPAAGSRNLRVLARVLEACACYDLIIGDLDQACELLGGLLQDHVAMSRRGHG